MSEHFVWQDERMNVNSMGYSLTALGAFHTPLSIQDISMIDRLGFKHCTCSALWKASNSKQA